MDVGFCVDVGASSSVESGNCSSLMWMSDLALVWRAGIAAAGSLGKRKKFGLGQVEDKRKEWRGREREKNKIKKEGKKNQTQAVKKKMEGCRDLRFIPGATHLVVGPSGSGKTFRMCEILRWKNQLFQGGEDIKNIVFCYAAWQPCYKDLSAALLRDNKISMRFIKRSRVLSSSYSSLRPPLRAEIVSLLSMISCPR